MSLLTFSFNMHFFRVLQTQPEAPVKFYLSTDEKFQELKFFSGFWKDFASNI